MDDSLLRRLPSVQRVLDHGDALELEASFGRRPLTEAVRLTIDRLRNGVRDGSLSALPSVEALLAEAASVLRMQRRPYLRRVLNATGIMLHTNLGRAPLAAEAIAAMADVGAHYTNLEYDLPAGSRGSRTAGVEGLLRALTGAEAALAVNNGAAAILLALAALGGGGEVIVSRGELVEIGGGFRIPDVIRQGGATLVEVGATNKTRPSDYAAALCPRTRVLLKVHQSNFRIAGFTAEATIAELSAVARSQGALVVADVGSGLLQPTVGVAEPTLREALETGADLVTCSGDKLLGGPQAGLILGSAAAVEPLRRHPLLRAVRLDKLSLAALEATLRLHRDAPELIPIRRMLFQQPDELRARAERLQAIIGVGEIVQTEAYVGGGALPDQQRMSWAVALSPAAGANMAAHALRSGDPAVVGRIADDRLLLDVVAISNDEIDVLAEAIGRVAI